MTVAHLGHGLLATALEGGIGYWARAYEIKREQLTGPTAMDDFEEYTSVRVVEHEDAMSDLDPDEECYMPWDAALVLDDAFARGLISGEHIHTVTADELLNFFMKVVNGDPNALVLVGFQRGCRWALAYRDDPECPDLDAEDADVLFQIVALGEVVYG